ncbi:hypothetical protein D9M68_991630 [compost metagenome]
MAVAGLAPQAELGAQAVVLARRLEHLGFGGSEGRQQLDQAGFLFGELGGVAGGIELGTAHGLLGNSMNYVTCRSCGGRLAHAREP